MKNIKWIADANADTQCEWTTNKGVDGSCDEIFDWVCSSLCWCSSLEGTRLFYCLLVPVSRTVILTHFITMVMCHTCGCYIKCFITMVTCHTGGSIQGAPVYPPLRVPIPSFWHRNFMKCNFVGSWCPPSPLPTFRNSWICHWYCMHTKKYTCMCPNTKQIK